MKEMLSNNRHGGDASVMNRMNRNGCPFLPSRFKLYASAICTIVTGPVY